MRPLSLDFAGEQARRSWPGWALLSGALILAAWLFNLFLETRVEVDALEIRVQKVRRTLDRQHLAERTQANKPTTDDVLTKRLVRNGPEHWETLLDALEEAANETVTLLSLVPEAGGLTLTGEAKHLEATTAYMKRLQTQRVFAKAQLIEYEVAKDRAQRPIRFTISIPLGGDAS